MLIRNYKKYAFSLLFALNIFIVFILVFASQVVVPKWLQPVGRLHPLILHFPIVIIIMAIVLEWYRFKDRIRYQESFQDFISMLWLVGALSAGITVVMGLFLSKEPGYEGNTLEFHKWFGVSVFFISSATIWARNNVWYSVKVARSVTLISVVCLFAAGHFGADLTHGNNFVLQPVWQPAKHQVAINQALVFKDVIQPIFDTKCISCHNSDKLKGGLMLIDEKSILKGGKSGKLFETGEPQVSLLLRRIHLPAEEKEHMPPAGKPQLTPEEAKLLYLWIKEKSEFTRKVIDLPFDDSLRQLSTAHLEPSGISDDEYDFSATDEKLIKKLNNNYRSIYSMGKESPAVGVNIYNRKNYGPRVLNELTPIQKQVVSLSLDHMPVHDSELKDIAKFENLRRLNLDFTDITGTSLQELATLKHLKVLSLSGTKLSPLAVKQLSLVKGPDKVVIWNCGLQADQLAELKQANKNVQYVAGFKDDHKPIKLNPPQLKKTQQVYTNSSPLLLVHPINGVEMRYTTDGREPDSLMSPLYRPGIVLTKNNIVLKVRAYKAGWLSSDIVQFDFHKCMYTPDSVSFLKFPSFQSSPQRASVLVDKQMGSDYTPDGKWIGSQKEMVLYVQFEKSANLKSITVSCRRGSLPGVIEIWDSVESGHTSLLKRVIPKASHDQSSSLNETVECELPHVHSTSRMKLVFKPGSGGFGQPRINQSPYFFIDEVFFN